MVEKEKRGGSDVRVICQTRSLEMFEAIVMRGDVELENWKIEIAIKTVLTSIKLCVSRMPRPRIGRGLAKAATLGIVLLPWCLNTAISIFLNACMPCCLLNKA